jgi:hypothetical protein
MKRFDNWQMPKTLVYICNAIYSASDFIQRKLWQLDLHLKRCEYCGRSSYNGAACGQR